MATARSASTFRSKPGLAETLATRLPTKTRSEKSSLSDDSVFLDLAEADADRLRAGAHHDRIGRIGAGLAGEIDQLGGTGKQRSRIDF